MTYTLVPSTLLCWGLLAGTTFAFAACGDAAAGDSDGSTTIEDPSTSTQPGTTGDEPPTTGASTSTTDAVTTGPDETSTTGTDTGTDTSTTSTTEATTTEVTTGEPDGWLPPDCTMVTGTGAVTFSHDQGATLAPMDQVIVPVHYTFGLVALGKPGAMLAGSGNKLLASSDAGCSWHEIGAGTGPNSPALRLVAAGETRAYAFGDGDTAIVRVDDEVITKLTAPGGELGIVGVGVDREDPDHVRLGAGDGALWDSVDAGQTWTPAGVGSIADSLAYRAAFDPGDLDHAVVGALGQGVRVTFDGGASWTSATGLGAGQVNGFNAVISPAMGDVVWVEGYDLADNDDAKARHIWRSDDGGASFTSVVESDEATLYNGNHLFAHPTDPGVLYFVFGSNFQGYGTDLYRYDHAADEISLTHNMWHDTVIAFLPGDPSWIYLGLSIEPGGG